MSSLTVWGRNQILAWFTSSDKDLATRLSTEGSI